LLFVTAALDTGTVGELRMKGREVFRHAVGLLPTSSVKCCRMRVSARLDWVVPHPNARILDATAAETEPRSGK
jgi:3-oxoacyl-[acyl-carrier-protein] synthase-3